MTHEYVWKNNEANFGPPIEREVVGGMHINFEIILKHRDNFIALRRPDAIPGHEHPPIEKTEQGYLYFCHNLIIHGESIEDVSKGLLKNKQGSM